MSWEEVKRDTKVAYVNTCERDIVMTNTHTKKKVLYRGIRKRYDENEIDFKARLLRHIDEQAIKHSKIFKETK